MNRKEAMHSLIDVMSFELLQHIKEKEQAHMERWVAAASIRTSLDLNFVAVPKENTQYGEKGWLFAILARILEDRNLVEYKKELGRAYYRSKR